MKIPDPKNPGDEAFDMLDEKIRQALMEEGAIIPETVEEVRKAKVRLKTQPVTLPPHLHDPLAVNHKAEVKSLPKDKRIIAQECLKTSFVGVATERTGSKTPDVFVEAVLIAQITRLVAKPDYPLGHLRQNKLVYFAHRKADEDVTQHFSKLPAGPYSPWAKYQGPEKVAQENGYVKKATVGRFVGFLVGDKIDKIDQYISRYPVCGAVQWVVGQFRFIKNEELELLATVDFAAIDLKKAQRTISMEAVKNIIATNREWAPKLNRSIFSDANITKALARLKQLFPKTYT